MIETKEYYDYAKNVLYKMGYRYYNSVPINERRYEIVKGYRQFKDMNILLIYKTEWFLKFGELFKDKNGIGESINKADLKLALAKDVKVIVRVTPQKHIYVIPIKNFILDGERWTCKEGKDMISISAHEFRNINTFKDINDVFGWE